MLKSALTACIRTVAVVARSEAVTKNINNLYVYGSATCESFCFIFVYAVKYSMIVASAVLQPLILLGNS